MPELPEVETIKRFLEKKIVGEKIEKIEILSPKQFVGNPNEAKGTRVKSIERRAKILIIKLDNSSYLLIHLKLTGQIVFLPKNKGKYVALGHPIPYAGGDIQPGKPARSTRVIIHLEKGDIFFNDLRKFGWIKLVKNTKELNGLGVEPLSKEFTLKILTDVLSRSRRAVKLVLLDQKKIAGIGNIYANDALWEAGIDPRKPANRVKKTKALHSSIKKVLKEGIKYGGASAADEAYIQPDASKGNYQYHFRVYQRENKPCPRDKHPIKRINLGGRGTFFCSQCQT